MTIPFPDHESLTKRATPETLKRQSEQVTRTFDVTNVAGVVPTLLMILNAERQIVYANNRVLQLMGVQEINELWGFRAGDVFRCSRAAQSEDGCGTTAFCRTCGAMQAILAAQRGEADIRECRIMQKDGALDLRVWTMPIVFDNESFTIFSVLDIRDEKRRRALERVFFHDIMNTAVGVRGLSELLASGDPANVQQFQPLILELAEKMIEDIQAQRDLLNAENSTLAVKWGNIESRALATEMVRIYHSMAEPHSVSVVAGEPLAEVTFTSDVVLLRRVLGNLLKNAFEASQAGDTVTLTCKTRDDQVIFSVHNPSVIPPDVQAQLFQRSFSTKGEGRGLGTYSVKLLTENYLKGRISFSSAADAGTVFSVQYPLNL